MEVQGTRCRALYGIALAFYVILCIGCEASMYTWAQYYGKQELVSENHNNNDDRHTMTVYLQDAAVVVTIFLYQFFFLLLYSTLVHLELQLCVYGESKMRD